MALYLDMSKPEAFQYLFSWKHLQAVVAIPAREVTTGGSGSLCHICQDAPSLAALQGQRWQREPWDLPSLLLEQ